MRCYERCPLLCRIAYGTLGVGHPEETFSLSCSSTSADPAVLAAWSDPWPVLPDPAKENCYLYNATARDTISGMADHFGVDVRKFVEANTKRGVIPTELLGEPPRPEPQLGGPWGGAALQVCDPVFGTFANQGEQCFTMCVCCHRRECCWGCRRTLPSCTAHSRAVVVLLCCCCGSVTCSYSPSGGGAIWDAGCINMTAGSKCSGACPDGWGGVPSATCGNDKVWVVTSGCTPLASKLQQFAFACCVCCLGCVAAQC